MITLDQDFFWQSDNETKKYRLARWNILCRPKSQGGLGIQDLEIKNIAFLSKWVYKLLTENGVWQEIIHNKYVGSKAISQVYWKPGHSHYWSGVMKAKEFFFQFGTFSVRDSSQIRFREDNWLGTTPLNVQYPNLYRIVRHKFVTIKQVLAVAEPGLDQAPGPKKTLQGKILTSIRLLATSKDTPYKFWLCA